MTANRLNGRVAIVTGAGRGIGRAIAHRFSKEGARVTLAARTPAQIREVAAEIEANGGLALPVRCDVSSEDDVGSLVEKALERFGRIDILVNNAGINLPPIDLTETDPKAWRDIIDVNLNGAFLCTRAVLPHMKANGSGVVLNISSVGGRRGAAGRGPYRASKAALINLTETIAAEGADYGVRAVCLCPGGRRYRHDAADRPGRRQGPDEAGTDCRSGGIRRERRGGDAQRGGHRRARQRQHLGGVMWVCVKWVPDRSRGRREEGFGDVEYWVAGTATGESVLNLWQRRGISRLALPCA